MQKVNVIGADAGNDALKLKFKQKNHEGKDQFEVMNVVAPGYNRRIIGNEIGQLSNLLDVTIVQDNIELGRYFVGGLAYKENRGDIIEKNKRDIKAKSMDTIILLVTGIAYGLYDPAIPVKSENVAVGTLLPTEEFWSEEEDLVEFFEERLKRNYKVKFNSPIFRGAEISITFVDDDIQPESAAGHLAAIYNIDGTLKEHAKVDNEVQLGIFVGSITTEVSVYNDGEFEPRGFLGIDLGTSDPLDKIIDDLGIEITRHHIDHVIRKEKKLVLNIKGKAKDYTEDLKKYSDIRFNFFVKQLVNQINKKLSRQGINTELITRVNIGGGGAIQIFEKFKNEFNVDNIYLVDDARFANAKGALFSIVQKLKEDADEVLDIN